MDPMELARALHHPSVGVALGNSVFQLGPHIRHSLIPTALAHGAPAIVTKIEGDWETAEYAAAIVGYSFRQEQVSINHAISGGHETAGVMLGLPPATSDAEAIAAFEQFGVSALHPPNSGWYFPDWDGTDPLGHAEMVLATAQRLGAAVGHVSVISGRVKVLHEGEYAAVFAKKDPARGGLPPESSIEQRRYVDAKVAEIMKEGGLG